MNKGVLKYGLSFLRLCAGVSYIPHIARGSKNHKDIGILKQQLPESLKIITRLRTSLQISLTSADKDKNKQLKNIRDSTERLIKHARELEKAAVDDVKDRYEITTDVIKSEIASLDDAATSIDKRLKSLENIHKNSDSQVFVDLKQGHQQVREARQLEQRLKFPATGSAMPEFVMGTDVDHFLNEVKSLGSFLEKNVYRVILHGEYNVRASHDKTVCAIADSCELSNGTVLVTDYDNRCIKKLNSSYKVTERLDMPVSPVAICHTDQDMEVAVTLTEKKQIQFVNIRGGLKLTRSFKVEDCCRGLCYNKGQLFVSCGGYTGHQGWAPEGPGFVGIYSMSGALLRKIQLDGGGQQIFSVPRHITASDNGNRIHVADSDGGVLTVDRHGTCLMSAFSDGLQGSNGVCTVTDENILACGWYSNNVLQMDAAGEMVTELLNEEDGIKKPRSVVFHRHSSRLVISQRDSNTIKVYNFY